MLKLTGLSGIGINFSICSFVHQMQFYVTNLPSISQVQQVTNISILILLFFESIEGVQNCRFAKKKYKNNDQYFKREKEK